MTGLLLVLLAIAAGGTASLLYARWNAKHHRHMTRPRYHDDTQWRAFDQSMKRHAKEKQP